MLPGKSNMYKGLVGLYTWLFSYLASLVSQSFSGVRSNLSPPFAPFFLFSLQRFNTTFHCRRFD